MKKMICMLAAALLVLLCSVPVNAAAEDSSQQETSSAIYEEQMQQSGASQLQNKLPDSTQKLLDGLGVDGTDWNSITSITAQNYFQKIFSIFTGQARNPLRVLASVVAVILLCAVLNALKISFGEKPLGGVIGMVGTLCICVVMVPPIVSCISDAAQMISAASTFLLACVPVLAGIMIAAGQPVTAGSYQMLMLAAGNGIAVFSSGMLVPMMNIFLALSVVSSVSPDINLGSLCAVLNKSVKWVMALFMTLFTGLITMHSIVASSADSTGAKAAKFVVSSCVPIVGNALGEALNSISGCVKLLKSGVGAFGLLAGIGIFLPIIAECLLWMLTLSLCSGIGQVFELREITTLLRASSDVISTMLAIVLCCMAILVFSTVVMLIIGGAA